MTDLDIYTIDTKQEEKFLRSKTEIFKFEKDGSATVGEDKLSRKEIEDLIQRMKKIMKQANGIGLSANQIGLPYRMFVAQVPDSQGNNKFYVVFNPSIEKKGKEEESMEEGCLSVLGCFGDVQRSYEVLLKGLDKKGRPTKIKAWALLARVFQHEVDHLDGKLFIDRAKSISRVENN